MLLAARLALAVLPPRRVLAWANRQPKRIRRFVGGEEISGVAAAVEYMGGRPWTRSVCLPRALATQAMLRRRGVVSSLCLGVNRTEVAISAHAWIEFRETVVVGGAEAPEFRRIAMFGG